MKTLFFIMFLSISLVTLAQVAPKKSTMAIVKMDDKKQAISKVIDVFTSAGFIFKTVETEAGIFTTEGKRGKGCESMYNITIKDDGTTKINGLMTIGSFTIEGFTSDSWSKIENKGMKGSPIKNAWLELESLATQLSAQVTYQ